MTIDTERLKTDAAYWDEVDDTKGKATHYCTQGGGFCSPDYIRHCDIPRPTKPAAPEWDGDGLPPVGCKCEYKGLNCWHPVTINAIGRVHVLMDNLGVEICRHITGLDFRPVRTKEQRDRDDLAEVLANAFDATYEDCQEAADAAISAGWTKP